MIRTVEKRYEIGDSITFKIEVRDTNNELADPDEIYLDIVDFDNNKIIENKSMDHNATGEYSLDVYLSNASFQQGGYYAIIHGTSEGYHFYEEKFFYVNPSRKK